MFEIRIYIYIYIYKLSQKSPLSSIHKLKCNGAIYLLDCVNTQKCTHFGIVTVERDLLKLMMLSVTFQKCLRSFSFRIAHKAGL